MQGGSDLKISILIIEDDEAISNLIKINLSMAGYESNQVFDGLDAFNLLKEETFDLILMDIMLPGMDGFELMKKIKDLNIPVIFLTAKNGLADKVTGLTSGAEDYIVKPFETVELLARIEIVLRRYSKNNNCIEFKNLKIYEDERIIKKDSETIDLTLKEFELMLMLVKNKNMALSREYLLEKIWGYEYMGETRTIDTHIQKIRKKLNLTDNIKTVYKIGYRLEE
ncbi:two component transcriptional regulator, winged helix family [Clostridium sp. DL-VIII]|nr:two component transcriptional regulator, winged helix family [Clostridium sp. DL-VIII]